MAVTRCDFTRRLEDAAAGARISLRLTSPSVGRRAAPSRRGDDASGRVRRRQGRERQLRPGRLLQAPPDHPAADVLGKPPSATCGLALMSRPACIPPSLCLGLVHRFSVSADRIIRNHHFGSIYTTLGIETSAAVSRIAVTGRNKISGVISAVQFASAAPEAHYHMFIRSRFMSGWSSFGFKYRLSRRLQLFICAL